MPKINYFVDQTLVIEDEVGGDKVWPDFPSFVESLVEGRIHAGGRCVH